jgi:hypothetical protein
MDITQVRELQDRIQKMLDGLKTPGQKYAFSISDLKSPSDTLVTFTLKIEDTKKLSTMGEVFKQQAKAHGLEPEDLNQMYWSRGKPFRIIGADWSAKFPVIAVNEDNNKHYSFKLDAIVQAKKETLETRARYAKQTA